MNKISCLAAIVAATLGAPAFAGGLATPEPEPTIIPEVVPIVSRIDGDWEGFYAGAQLGYGDFRANNVKPSGAIGGVQAGYRWDLGTTVLGVELDYIDGNIKKTQESSLRGDQRTRVRNLVQLKGQLGYDLGKTLIYATAGYAHAKFETDNPLIGSKSKGGWLVGAGLDYAIDSNWILGGEVTYQKFGSIHSTVPKPKGATATIRVNYRF